MDNPLYISPFSSEEMNVSRFLKEPSPIPFLVEGLVAKGTVGAMWSQGGTGKSTISFLLALCVALRTIREMYWLGEYPINYGGKVLYISSEDPEIILHHRQYNMVRRLSSELGIPQNEIEKTITENFFVLNMCGKAEPLMIFSDGKVKQTDLYDRIKQTIMQMKPTLVIIDTKAKFSGISENDNSLVSQEIIGYEALVKDIEANLIILHHTTKSTNTFRGASSFFDSLRWGIHLKTIDNNHADFLGISSCDKDLYFELVNSKQNYARKSQPVIIKRVDDYWFEKINVILKPDTAQKLEGDIAIIRNHIVENNNTGFTQLDLQNALCGKTRPLSNKALQKAISSGLETGVFENRGNRTKMQLFVIENLKANH